MTENKRLEQPLAQGGHRVCNESECCHVQNSAEAMAQCLEYQATIARLVADLERLAQSPTDETVREAVEWFVRHCDIENPITPYGKRLLTLLRAGQAPRLTDAQAAGLHIAYLRCKEEGSLTDVMEILESTFPGVFGKEGWGDEHGTM